MAAAVEGDISLPWPVGIPELKRLDELLRCGICYDFLSTSMVTACSHNYCSVCIRQYLSYKTQCPACFQETTTQHLRNNRLLDEIIGLFPSLRDKVARISQTSKGDVGSGYFTTSDRRGDCKEEQAVASNCHSGRSFTNTRTPSKKRLEDETPSPNRPASVKGSLFLPKNDGVASATPKRNLATIFSPQRNAALSRPSPPQPCSSKSSSNNKRQAKCASSLGSSSGSRSASVSPSSQSSSQTVSGHFSIFGDSKSTNNESSGQDGSRVSCPVCSVDVPERNINFHLDACLRRQQMSQDDQDILGLTPKRKPLPKLVYTLLSEKQMRQRLKDFGLSVQGDKQALVTRHRRYTTLYNAECDVAEPRPVSEIVVQVDREERERARVISSQSIFTYDRKTAPEIIEKEQNKYLKNNDGHFAKLIDEVRGRQRGGRTEEDLKKYEGQDEEGTCGQLPKDVITTLKNSGMDTSLSQDEVLENKSADAESHEIPKLNEDEDKREEQVPCDLNNRTQLRENALINKSKNEGKTSCDLNREGSLGTCDAEIRDRMHTDVVDGKSTMHSLHQSQENMEEKCQSECIRDSLISENKQSNEKPINPSPDIFLASPLCSDDSNDSMSLLKDCDPWTPMQLTKLSGQASESDEEELIPAHQPETHHHIVTKDMEDTPKPSSQQASSPSLKATKPDLDFHHPGLTDRGDEDFLSSELLQALESEDDFYIPQRLTRQSSRKRKPIQTEVATSQRGRRKKKK